MDLDELYRVLTDFAAEDLEHALIGGVALNLHGIIRSTEDVDFFTRVRLVSPKTLHWLKRDTVRLKDRLDAQALAERSGITEG